MKSFSNISKKYVWIISCIGVLILVLLISSFLNNSKTDTDQINDTQQISEAEKLSIDDIENISVHSGLDIQCPNLQGVSQNGYAYTVLFKGEKQAIERLGCGTGQPEVFAEAIAQDLERSGAFAKLSVDDVMDKMVFKFYSLNTAQ